MKLDSYDRRILTELQRDGTLNNHELAQLVGLTASPCSRRVKALEDAGVIQGRRVVVDPEKLGLHLEAMLSVRMDRHVPERFERFEQAIACLPEVRQCLMITGQDYDYLLRVIVPDMKMYQAVLLKKITTIDGVVGVQSSFVLRYIVDTQAVPLSYIPA